MYPDVFRAALACPDLACGDFPLELRRQTPPSPPRVGCRLEEAHVADGFVETQAPQAVERVHPPILAVAVPVPWRFPIRRFGRGPSFGYPQLGPLVPLVFDEGHEFGVAHRPIGDCTVAKE